MNVEAILHPRLVSDSESKECAFAYFKIYPSLGAILTAPPLCRRVFVADTTHARLQWARVVIGQAKLSPPIYGQYRVDLRCASDLASAFLTRTPRQRRLASLIRATVHRINAGATGVDTGDEYIQHPGVTRHLDRLVSDDFAHVQYDGIVRRQHDPSRRPAEGPLDPFFTYPIFDIVAA